MPGPLSSPGPVQMYVENCQGLYCRNKGRKTELDERSTKIVTASHALPVLSDGQECDTIWVIIFERLKFRIISERL